MQRLEVSYAVRRIYMSLGAKGLITNTRLLRLVAFVFIHFTDTLLYITLHYMRICQQRPLLDAQVSQVIK